jgi:hypothetical protein
MWRRLREDFTYDDVFTFTLWLAAAVLLGQKGDSMGVIALSAGALWWWCRKKEWDFWELIDFVSVVGLWLWFGSSLAWGPGAVWDTISALLGILLAWYIRNNYRRFRWYISGKLGLVGLFVLLYFSVSQVVIAIFLPTKVYWGSLTLNQLIAAWVIAFSVVAIYLRSGRKPGEDIGWLVKTKHA